jgi:DNA processing protein
MIYSIGLTQIPNVGTVTAQKLVAHFGSSEEVFRASKKELMRTGVREEIASSIIKQEVLAWAEKEIAFCEQHDIQILCITDAKYPQRLTHYSDAPFILYYKGNVDLNPKRTVGIVGTRRPSVQGRDICVDVVDGLKKYKPIIVSGLALGIDITAHRRCLEVGLPTIGVMGNGMGRIYPHEHRKTAEEMVENGGLLTEFSSSMGPEARNFPMRNRIIAGLSDCVVVVETATKGGSIITANLANDYNKDVFAVPGRLGDKYSQGCNWLIKTNKAALVEKADDIAYGMNWDGASSEKRNKPTVNIQPELFVEMSPKEQKIMDLLRANGQMGIDNLTNQAAFTPAEVSSLLLGLEFKGVVTTLRGKQYVAN